MKCLKRWIFCLELIEILFCLKNHFISIAGSDTYSHIRKVFSLYCNPLYFFFSFCDNIEHLGKLVCLDKSKISASTPKAAECKWHDFV